MSINKTPNLKMNSWVESEAVDFSEVNDNFTAIDDCTLCYERDVTNMTYSGGLNGQAPWVYRKYTGYNQQKSKTDSNIIKTLDANTRIDVKSLQINSGSSAPYFSSTFVEIDLPFTMVGNLTDVQMHLAVGSDLAAFPIDLTDYSTTTVVDKLKVKLASINKEDTQVNKWLTINVKGVLNE